MEVNCDFFDARTTQTTKALAERTINAGAAGNFQWRVQQHAGPGNTVLFDDDMEMVVVGGRHSICQAFATPPIVRYTFVAPAGRAIYASHESSSKKGWAFGTGALRMAQIMSGPAYSVGAAAVATCKDPLSFGSAFTSTMKRTYSPKVNTAVAGVLQQAAKTRTVLHLFSEALSFNGHQLGSRLTGAEVSLRLSQFFV